MAEYNEEFFREKEIEYIQFQFTNLAGQLKEVEFPVNMWEELKNGTGVDGSSLGFLTTEQSDMRAVPDLETFAILAYSPRVGRFICDLYDTQNQPYPLCPRGILKRIRSKAKEMGYIFHTRPELEWYFLDEDLDPADEGKYMCTLPDDLYHDVRRQTTDYMLEMLPFGGPHTIHHEGGPGQQEIEIAKIDALYNADNIQTIKILAKIAADEADIICTFMPKPFLEEAGSGLHIHLYLEDKNGKNIFATPQGISDELRYFIGGVLKHARAMCAILNPSTNSYKRLVPGHEAPVYTSWGVGNRTALMRVPGYDKKAHMEYRAGDATMNIYLGCAVLLAAGLDGIKNKIEPNTPTIANVDVMNDEERKRLGIFKLPNNLDESLHEFEQSSFIREIFGEKFIAAYVKMRRNELEEYKVAVINKTEREWEFDRYLNC